MRWLRGEGSAGRVIQTGGRVLTDRTELGVVFADAFDGMQFHVDLLSGAQFCKDDVRVRRLGWIHSHDRPLFALWDPLEL